MTICTVTPAANTQVGIICKENNCYAVSLNITGGGCAGFEYKWGTLQQDEVQANDFVIECEEGNFVIGAHSLMFLAGTEIDYVKSIVGSNFEIKNPNTQTSCGCGVSVSFDMDNLPNLASSAV